MKSSKLAGQFAALCLLCGLAVVLNPNWGVRLVGIWAALSFGWVALVFWQGWAWGFGKQANGRLSPLAWVGLAPYLLLNYALLALEWRHHRGAEAHEIAPNLWLSMRLPNSLAKQKARQDFAVLDVAAELSEAAALRALTHYRSAPTLDTLVNSDVRANALWINQQRTQRPVLIHCALGRGRSATLVIAALLLSGEIPNLEAALQYVAGKRKIGVHADQRAALEALMSNQSSNHT